MNHEIIPEICLRSMPIDYNGRQYAFWSPVPQTDLPILSFPTGILGVREWRLPNLGYNGTFIQFKILSSPIVQYLTVLYTWDDYGMHKQFVAVWLNDMIGDDILLIDPDPESNGVVQYPSTTQTPFTDYSHKLDHLACNHLACKAWSSTKLTYIYRYSFRDLCESPISLSDIPDKYKTTAIYKILYSKTPWWSKLFPNAQFKKHRILRLLRQNRNHGASLYLAAVAHNCSDALLMTIRRKMLLGNRSDCMSNCIRVAETFQSQDPTIVTEQHLKLVQWLHANGVPVDWLSLEWAIQKVNFPLTKFLLHCTPTTAILAAFNHFIRESIDLFKVPVWSYTFGPIVSPNTRTQIANSVIFAVVDTLLEKLVDQPQFFDIMQTAKCNKIAIMWHCICRGTTASKFRGRVAAVLKACYALY